MLHDIVKKGSTNRSVRIRIVDATTGLPETAVEHDESGIDLWYRREGATKTPITEAALTALDDAHSDGGLEHIADGVYRLDLPDAAFASGAEYVEFGGAVTGMVVFGGVVRLVDIDVEDTVRAGLTALPNAAADAAGGLPISDAGGLDLDAILADTNELQTDDVPGLIASLNNLSAAAVNAEVVAALAAIHLDHLLAAADSDTPVDNSVIAKLATASGDWSDFDATDSLEGVKSDTASLLSRLGSPENLGGGADISKNLRDIAGATFATATDALEAIRNRGDAAWTTGAGGSSPLEVASGTIGGTGNDATHLHLAGLGYGDDELNDLLLVVVDDSASLTYVTWITDWADTGDLATVETLPFTPEDSTDTYIVLAIKKDSDVAAILVDTGTTIPGVLGSPAGASLAADIAENQTDLDAVLEDTDLIDDGTSGLAKIATDVAAVLVDTADIQPKLGTVGDLGSGATLGDNLGDMAGATFATGTDSLEAIRDRGDAAWTTGGGGSLTQALNVQPVLPMSIDLANTATVRLGLILTNAVDDLPSTAEIAPGTISIERKAVGGTSWSAVVTDSAMSEQAGMVYFDEVFDSGSGYAEGDSIRVTFKSVVVTAEANDHEICDSNGIMFQTVIRETMRGTDSAALASVATEARLAELDAANLPSDVDDILADTADMQPKLGTPAADISADIAAVKAETAAIVDDTDLIDDGTSGLAKIATDVAAVLADTADMQPKLGTPAADVSADIAAVKVDTAAVLVDTGTTLPDILGTPAGASLAADIAENQTDLDAVLAFIDTEIAAILAAVDTEIAAILADTNELQTDWTDAGRLDALLDAVKAKTDQLVFTVTNVLDANIAAVDGDAWDGAGKPYDTA